jgi:Fimbrial assembly protein (PilN)/Pilus assembly protein, PilO
VSSRKLFGLLLLAALPSLRPAAAVPAIPVASIRSLETLRDRQEVGVRLLASVQNALPQLLLLRHLTLDGRAATLDGAAWSSSAAAELVEHLGKEKIASFGPPKLVSARAEEDGYDSFSIALAYQGPPDTAGSGDLLKRVAPPDELLKLQGQIRKALKDLQLNVQDYRTGSRPLPNGPVDLWPVAIRIEGAAFAQMGAFLERLSGLSRLVVVEELAMEARDKDRPEHSVRLRLSLPTLARGRKNP